MLLPAKAVEMVLAIVERVALSRETRELGSRDLGLR